MYRRQAPELGRVAQLGVAFAVGALAGALAMSAWLEARYAHRLDSFQRAVFTLRLESDVTSEPVPRLKPGAIVLFGDSRARRWNPLPDLSSLAGDGRAPAVTVTVAGRDGDTTVQMRERLDREVLASAPNAVVVAGGGNDLRMVGAFPAREAQIMRQAIDNLAAMARAITDRNALAVLLTGFPFGPAADARLWSPRSRELLTEFNRAVMAMAGPRVAVLDAWSVLGGDAGAPFAIDLLHIDADGYRKLNRALEDLLRERLGRTDTSTPRAASPGSPHRP